MNAKTDSRQILDSEGDEKFVKELGTVKNAAEREQLAVNHIFNRITPDLDHKKELID